MAKTEVKKNRSPRRKRRGLRFLISLIILIAAAGAVFWFGWVQFSLEEGQVGVVYTKSHGYEDEVLNSGDFAWRWQALLPTNLTVHAFDTETRSFIFNREGSLPSGDLYATMAGEGIDFNWSVKGQVSYRINPDSLPSLVADGLAGDNLDSYYTGFEARVEGEISRILANLAPGDTPESITAAMESMEAELLRQAENLDERIDVVEVTILDWVSPDMDLYVESRRLYLDSSPSGRPCSRKWKTRRSEGKIPKEPESIFLSDTAVFWTPIRYFCSCSRWKEIPVRPCFPPGSGIKSGNRIRGQDRA